MTIFDSVGAIYSGTIHGKRTHLEMFSKYCGKCKQLKTLDNFSRNKRNTDGFDSYCKECERARQKVNYANKR